MGPTALAIDHEVAGLDPVRAGVRRSPEQRPDPRSKLVQRKGLDHVVIRPRVEPPDPVRLLRARGDEDDGHLALGRRALPAQTAQEFVPARPWQHPVEQHEVHPRGLERLPSARRVLDLADLISRFAEVPRDHLPHGRLVLHDQNARNHAPYSPSRLRTKPGLGPPASPRERGLPARGGVHGLDGSRGQDARVSGSSVVPGGRGSRESSGIGLRIVRYRVSPFPEFPAELSRSRPGQTSLCACSSLCSRLVCRMSLPLTRNTMYSPMFFAWSAIRSSARAHQIMSSTSEMRRGSSIM